MNSPFYETSTTLDVATREPRGTSEILGFFTRLAQGSGEVLGNVATHLQHVQTRSRLDGAATVQASLLDVRPHLLRHLRAARCLDTADRSQCIAELLRGEEALPRLLHGRR